MSADPVIKVEGLGKRYQLGARGAAGGSYRTLRDTLAGVAKSAVRRLRTGSRPADSASEDFWALREISFEVAPGEVVGIVGRNGAGKSTLLKVLSRITEPTTGRVTIGGRVASLLEVGTGFHPELTGRENIFLNGAILGMHRAEIRAKFDEIVAFAEVERFLDTPVKRYSSGMYVRLAFAVAAHLEPEILIIDEVLAVGDAEFQKKCLGKMEDVAHQGRTVLFVSHQMNSVRTLCSRCLLLRNGLLLTDGPVEDVISAYLQATPADARWLNNPAAPEHANSHFLPLHFALVDGNGQALAREVRADERVGFLIEGEISVLDPALVVGFALYTSERQLLFWSLQTDTQPDRWPKLQIGFNRLIGWLPEHVLNEGDYRAELIVSLHWRSWICQPEVNAPAINLRVRGGLSESPHWMEPRPGLLGPVLKFEKVA